MRADSKPGSADTQPGQPYRLHRWELPDSHPQRFVGSVYYDLVLDERDVLRPASMPVRS